MDNLTAHASLIAEDAEKASMAEEIKKLRRDLEEQRMFGEPSVDFSPLVRAVLTLAAQALGFILLFVLGTGTFGVTTQPDIVRGLKFITDVCWVYLLLSLLIVTAYICYVAYKKEYEEHFPVDVMLLVYVGVDIVLLLLLVYQQGGLCRSMFLPVFFLIPTAYIIVERKERKYRWRRLLILVIITACICSSYHVAVTLPPSTVGTDAGPAEVGPAQGAISFLAWSLPDVTDFSSLSHAEYDKAIFRASLISAFVPIIQLLLVMFMARVGKPKPEAPPEEPPADALPDGT